MLPTTGIPYVIVSGEVVIRDSKFQEVWAGQPIRYPVEAKGRLVPAATGQRLKLHTVDSGGVMPDVR